jgi:hypothetical protein
MHYSRRMAAHGVRLRHQNLKSRKTGTEEL